MPLEPQSGALNVGDEVANAGTNAAKTVDNYGFHMMVRNVCVVGDLGSEGEYLDSDDHTRPVGIEVHLRRQDDGIAGKPDVCGVGSPIDHDADGHLGSVSFPFRGLRSCQ